MLGVCENAVPSGSAPGFGYGELPAAARAAVKDTETDGGGAAGVASVCIVLRVWRQNEVALSNVSSPSRVRSLCSL